MSILVSSPQHAQSTIPSSTVQRVNKANHTFTAIKKPAIVISPPSGQLQDKRIASSDQTDQASDEDSPIFQNVRQLALKSDPVPISMLHYRSSDPSNPSTKKPEKSAAPSESDLLHPKHATSSNTAPAIVQPTKSKKISKNKRPVSFAPSTKFQQQPKSALHRIQPWQAAPGYPVVYFQPIPGTAGNSSFQPVYFQPLAPLAPAPVPPMKPKTLINFSNEDYATSGTLKAAAENSRVLRERALEQEVLRARGEIQV
ncbi:hypothetical protein BC830DRAFT_476413 [Chytriomyces sp. MP71]|nr:hypothetical protein BC830DRAFT_476413 [Chytriomyces sp. MP71]